ncbi:hypothetical protein AMS59_22340 [Lysinibacillus sp. FJAT-14745]|uniref:GNAT family N-acetyltransferase n=1 Tax=Lysinibacillus sp. FJAT-14745 TaxID=1704289 RepID=UPI0006ABABE7|nr:GNAT family N-acetyltransferase [Lysinibacillus sp. FJAT-14745]KOP69667.1 hypothetical protein AMS59_22340 [Lysinibacillus sp. FJAT-14745]
MNIVIKRTNVIEAPILLAIQKEAFEDDLRKYEDHDTSPVNEPIERLLRKIELFIHYTVWHNNEIIGGIDVRDLKDNKYRLNRIFISKNYQNKGLGSEIMKLVEEEFPSAVEWVLDTPHLNIRNHHFYEKIGYKKSGQHQINEKLILIDYTKKVK